MAPQEPPARYRSSAEFNISNLSPDAIARATSFRRVDYDRAVRSFPSEHLAILGSISVDFARQSEVAPLGNLPLEILTNVLLHLDLRSLHTFRSTNTKAREAVNSLPGYRLVMTHALDVFNTILRTGLNEHFTIQDIVGMLRTETCAFCGKFAGFVSILAWKRCCFRCLQIRKETQVQAIVVDRRELAPSPAIHRQWRVMTTRPWPYKSMGTADGGLLPTVPIMSIHDARKMLRVTPLPHPPTTRTMPPLFSSPFTAARAIPYLGRSADVADHGVSCAGYHLAKFRELTQRYRGQTMDGVVPLWAVRDLGRPGAGLGCCTRARASWSTLNGASRRRSFGGGLMAEP